MADTIRVLIATDNHVGYAERDPIRGDDSWKTFHEVMCLSKEKDVDMVLLCGDLFHENKPSRKSLYNVMRSLRLNCYGEKPCELELLSDGSEHFDSTIGHANYEDPDINVAIPVFSIHGNHDDPSGEGLYAALDILEMAGLVNYFGRVPESDNITVRPLFFQKGNTKLALYGLSNVRDERLHRTFRDGNVVFKRPGTQQQDWFNLMCVHQNHHAHTETSYLPEDQLPDYMDLVVWGHEHECDPIAHKNPEKGFRVLQPGSSVATSLIPGEAATKHVFILTVTGRKFELEPVRLKTVRPFVYKDISLSQDKEVMKIAKKDNHRTQMTQYLEKIVKDLIKQARKEWEEVQQENPNSEDEESEFPLPIIRLRVDITSPDGGATKFEVENPQRFSNRFANEVANRNDVVQFITRKKASTARAATNSKVDNEILSNMDFENANVARMVKEFLSAQALTILPTNHFGDAVRMFIEKDDKHSMEMFVNESLADQIKHLVAQHKEDDEIDERAEADLTAQIKTFRGQMEQLFAQGQVRTKTSRKFKPKPDGWDSEWDGHWEDQPEALIFVDDDEEDDGSDDQDTTPAPVSTSARGRGRGRGSRGATASTRGRGRGRGGTKAVKSSTASSRGRKKAPQEDDDESEQEEEDVVMLDDDDDDVNEQVDEPEDNSQAMFIPERTNNRTSAQDQRTGTVKPTPRSTRAAAAAKKTLPKPSLPTSKAKQSTLTFSQSQTNGTASGGRVNGRATRANNEDIDNDDDDDDDAFETQTLARGPRKR